MQENQGCFSEHTVDLLKKIVAWPYRLYARHRPAYQNLNCGSAVFRRICCISVRDRQVNLVRQIGERLITTF